jgi:hypothetical protein
MKIISMHGDLMMSISLRRSDVGQLCEPLATGRDYTNIIAAESTLGGLRRVTLSCIGFSPAKE